MFLKAWSNALIDKVRLLSLKYQIVLYLRESEDYNFNLLDDNKSVITTNKKAGELKEGLYDRHSVELQTTGETNSLFIYGSIKYLLLCTANVLTAWENDSRYFGMR